MGLDCREPPWRSVGGVVNNLWRTVHGLRITRHHAGWPLPEPAFPGTAAGPVARATGPATSNRQLVGTTRSTDMLPLAGTVKSPSLRVPSGWVTR